MRTPSPRKGTAFVLATGPSMNQETAEMVRGHGLVAAVSDAYRLAPWADLLVSTDAAWWTHHRPEFAGRRFCASYLPGTETPRGCPTNWNSTVLACYTLRTLFNPARVVLLGVDFGGTHFFGPHPPGLKNTPPHRWPLFAKQFAHELRACRAAGVELVNATPGSALEVVPRVDLEKFLEEATA